MSFSKRIQGKKKFEILTERRVKMSCSEGIQGKAKYQF